MDATLRHLVQAAATLVDARYAAEGVLGAGGMLDDFVQLGIDDQTRALIGPLPTGHGPLGVPVEELGPLRLPEPARHGASVGFPPQHPPNAQPAGRADPGRRPGLRRLYLTEKTDEGVGIPDSAARSGLRNLHRRADGAGAAPSRSAEQTAAQPTSSGPRPFR